MACVDGRVDDGSTGVSLRVRVVVDVLAAEDRVARLHVLRGRFCGAILRVTVEKVAAQLYFCAA